MDEIEVRLRRDGYRRGKKGLLNYIRRLETERDAAVGPAPATPDEGGDLIADVHIGTINRLVAERNEARDALAAAEARIAAVQKLIDDARERNDSPLLILTDVEEALSVEATGTEGGGGHE
jgi:hypothetical protein